MRPRMIFLTALLTLAKQRHNGGMVSKIFVALTGAKIST